MSNKVDYVQCNFTLEELEKIKQAFQVCDWVAGTIKPAAMNLGFTLTATPVPDFGAATGKLLSYIKKAKAL